MTLTAPYTHSMRLGQGFNSYTHEVRLDGAVAIHGDSTAPALSAPTITVKEIAPTKPSGDATATAPSGMTADSTLLPPLVAPPLDRADSGIALDGIATGRRLADSAMGTTQTGPATTVEDLTATPSINQTVTYSTRSLDNVSDIADALNLSAATAIKYGSVHANASAGFLNENKVVQSQLNYVISVKVNNEDKVESVPMDFQPIDGLKPDDFTKIYGDCFISGFLRGGELAAIVSIKVNDKTKLRKVKAAADVQLAVGPTPAEVGAKFNLDKMHHDAFDNTEISISVNWSGGGKLKRSDEKWDMKSIVDVANRFPELVANNSSITSAILTRYETLPSFQRWRIQQAATPGWDTSFKILDYSPCTLYTSDLFNAFVSYKSMWQYINKILEDPSRYEVRRKKAQDDEKNIEHTTAHTLRTTLPHMPTVLEQEGDGLPPNMEQLRRPSRGGESIITNADGHDLMFSFDLDSVNWDRDPVDLDPKRLNEIRLLCREAMTIITEETARLVEDPSLAAAPRDARTQRILIRRPEYPYPEAISCRLPKLVNNDAGPDSDSFDEAVLRARSLCKGSRIFCNLQGDYPSGERKLTPFCSLELSGMRRQEGGRSIEQIPAPANISIHEYRKHWFDPSRFGKAATSAIGAIGFSFNTSSSTSPSQPSNTTRCPCHHHAGRKQTGANKFVSCSLSTANAEAVEAALNDSEFADPGALKDVVRIDIAWLPQSGRIAGLTFFDSFEGREVERLSWRQWGDALGPPAGVKTVTQRAPQDGSTWKFVGLIGYFDVRLLGLAQVLSRISGVWVAQM